MSIEIQKLRLNYHHRGTHGLSSVSIVSSDLEKSFVVGGQWIREIERRFAPITGDEFELFKILYVVITLEKESILRAQEEKGKYDKFYRIPSVFPKFFMSKVYAIMDQGICLEQIGKYFNEDATVEDLATFMEEPSLRNLANRVRLA